ncbi:MAG TPA: kynureninase [Candidatus Polarisedimenticolia bacterium]|nr:kynureninase [Candidatus Polarisedimenticolia bacterium]
MSGAAPLDEEEARRLDLADPLSRFRSRFAVPGGPDGRPLLYFCGHSLGLMPKAARALVDEELDDWEALGVEGHFRSRRPWYSYHEQFRDSGARLVGARPGEVVMMNGLTVNLHLMLATFYRPTADRRAILIEEHAFPSDHYAVASQIRHHGGSPDAALLVARARPGEPHLRTEDLERLIEERGREIAVVLLPGVQFYTGQALDLGRLAAAAHRQGCVFGADLAHAAGNLPLRLHDWQVDFAVWCSYKYLNSGPGAVAGCFIHERHGRDRTLPRFAGWWGNDPATRFEMRDAFVPREGADGWQLGNPPILALAPLLASLAIFEEAGIEALRARSVRMTSALVALLDRLPAGRIEILTPHNPDERGCQVSLRLPGGGARRLHDALAARGVVCDVREPNVLRFAPVPLYNTFSEIVRFARLLEEALA